MMLLRRLSQIVVFLWIFSIPTSIAYHYDKQAGFVHGVLVDYRIPTLSLSFVLLCLACVLCLLSKHIPKKTLIVALIFTFLFQSLLALYQFRFQHSLTGYIPFGEVDFSSTQIAKGVFFNGSLYKLPYGTTVHPNILAGFCVITFLLLIIQKILPIDRRYSALFFLIASFICFLTQSLSATIALLLGYAVFVFLQKKKHTTRLVRAGILVVPLLSFVFFRLPAIAGSQNTSLSRRSQLQDIATKMIVSHPVTGIGWNNFTLLQQSYGYVPSTVRFLQPVHNAFLLLITELGMIGWLICGVIIVSIWKMHQTFLPLAVSLIFISSFDHYFVTLTTGRMILILCILLYIFKRRNQGGEV